MDGYIAIYKLAINKNFLYTKELLMKKGLLLLVLWLLSLAFAQYPEQPITYS